MNNTISLQLPFDKDQLRCLKAGQVCLLTGELFVLRDAGHARLLAELEEQGRLPYGLEGHAIFYAGPTPARAGRPFGAIGPTTSSRMDFATPQLLRAGIAATIGKGFRNDAVKQAIKETGAIYFAAVGGVAALLAKCISSEEVIAYEELGTEALRKIYVEDFPVFVALDTEGTCLYDIESSGKTSGEDCAETAEANFVTDLADKAEGEGDDSSVLANSNLDASGVACEASISAEALDSASAYPGLFVTFEGGDGVGKTTQISLLAEKLQALGLEVLTLREPGGTAIGEELRRIVLDPNHQEMASEAELLIYEAARAQIVQERIVPALKRGAVVLCDRFFDSTIAYQAYGRGLSRDFIDEANAFACQGVCPDKTILLLPRGSEESWESECDNASAAAIGSSEQTASADSSCGCTEKLSASQDVLANSPQGPQDTLANSTQACLESAAAATSQGPDRLELAGLDFHTLVNAAFMELAQTTPRIVAVSTNGGVNASFERVYSQVESLLLAKGLIAAKGESTSDGNSQAATSSSSENAATCDNANGLGK